MQRILLNLLDDILRHKSEHYVLCQQVFDVQWQKQEFSIVLCVVKFSTSTSLP